METHGVAGAQIAHAYATARTDYPGFSAPATSALQYDTQACCFEVPASNV